MRKVNIRPMDWDKHQVFKKLWADLPDFITVLSDLELDIFTPNASQHIGDLGFVTWHGERMPRVKTILGKIQALRPKDVCSAHIYISILSKSKTFGRHMDSTDVFYIQGAGKTSWVVEDEGEVFNYALEEGDMIYVPKGMYHTPFPLSPRYGISIGFDTHTQREEVKNVQKT